MNKKVYLALMCSVFLWSGCTFGWPQTMPHSETVYEKRQCHEGSEEWVEGFIDPPEWAQNAFFSVRPYGEDIRPEAILAFLEDGNVLGSYYLTGVNRPSEYFEIPILWSKSKDSDNEYLVFVDEACLPYHLASKDTDLYMMKKETPTQVILINEDDGVYNGILFLVKNGDNPFIIRNMQNIIGGPLFDITGYLTNNHANL